MRFSALPAPIPLLEMFHEYPTNGGHDTGFSVKCRIFSLGSPNFYNSFTILPAHPHESLTIGASTLVKANDWAFDRKHQTSGRIGDQETIEQKKL
jgi:hypothetical protein